MKLLDFFRLGISPVPYVITDGQLADAVPVMGNFNYLVTSINSLTVPLGYCSLRLTLDATTAVSPTDQLAKTFLIALPYKGNQVALFSTVANTWLYYSIGSFVQITSPAVPSQMYDVFMYADINGALQLQLVAWTNDTTRAIPVLFFTGVPVKNDGGDPTTLDKRYLGTVRTTAGGLFEDSLAHRWVYNYYNRVIRPMRVVEATASWNYTTATVRQANANAANQLDFVMGFVEDPVIAEVRGAFENASNAPSMVAIGLNQTSVVATGCLTPLVYGGTNTPVQATASLKTFPALGRNTLTWEEWSAAFGTTTWLGLNGAGGQQSGIHGEVFA